MAVVVLLSSCIANPVNEATKSSKEERPIQEEKTQDSYQLHPFALPLTFELPKEEQNPLPFHAPEPVTYLRAPQENQEPNYYEVPIPAQELIAPIETQWNPSNDPNLYYDIPAVVIQQDLPTKEFPKKYIEELHNKKKPYSSRPKQELVVELIDEKEYDTRQKEIQKTFQKLAKKENQKDVKQFKVLKPKKKVIKEPLVEEPVAAGSVLFDQAPAQTFDQGLNAQIPASLGIPMHPSGGERLLFHVVGHDGPHSYKWGYDTGKG